ncbi:MAG: response regulator transcription factor [Rikenellaceae bacterium]
MSEGKVRVLLIDDDMMLGCTYVSGLQYLGYEVHYLSSFIAVEGTINEFRPHVVVLDVEIGAMDGIDESAALFCRFPELPIIFISSHAESDYVKRAIERGGATYLKKPFDLEELAVYVGRYARHSKLGFGFGSFRFDRYTNVLYNVETGRTERLSDREATILLLLIKSINTTLPRSVIEQHIGGCATTEFILNNTISRLRKILGDDSRVKIVTKSKVGYMLTDK